MCVISTTCTCADQHYLSRGYADHYTSRGRGGGGKGRRRRRRRRGKGRGEDGEGKEGMTGCG